MKPCYELEQVLGFDSVRFLFVLRVMIDTWSSNRQAFNVGASSITHFFFKIARHSICLFSDGVTLSYL